MFRITKFSNITFLALCLFIPKIVQASEQPHEHGVGQINIAIEGNEIELELLLPGADVVGFEHAASSHEEQHAIEDALEKLKKGSDIFLFPASAGCRMENVDVHADMLDSDHQGEGEKETHDHDQETHDEFRLHYHFHCQNPEDALTLKIDFFKSFPSLNELAARWITPSGQGSNLLKSTSAESGFSLKFTGN